MADEIQKPAQPPPPPSPPLAVEQEFDGSDVHKLTAIPDGDGDHNNQHIDESPADDHHPHQTSKSINSSNSDQSLIFNEETTRAVDLPDFEKKALEELKQLVKKALNTHQFSTLSPPPPPASSNEKKPTEEEPPLSQAVPPPLPPPEESGEVDSRKLDENVVAAENQSPPPPNQKDEEIAELAAPAVTIADDDGAKTVEAIEETIVAVSKTLLPSEEEHSHALDATEGENTPAISGPPAEEEVFIWGVKLLEDDRSDVILLKFLRARDFRVGDAFTMIKNTIRWRKEFGIEELLEQDLGSDLEGSVAFMHGQSREGHPVCYNVYGQFQNKELYRKTFSDEEKRRRFLRWRIQFLEKSIRKLDFRPGGISTIVQVNDLKDSPGPGKWELRQATKQALQLLQDNYPEFVAKQVFINVPWWYLAVNRMISPFLTQRTKSKFVFAAPSKSAETLFRYVAAEKVPVQYGGLSKDGDLGDAVTEVTVNPTAKHTVEFPVTEACMVSWEVRVVGWEVSYGAEFVPGAEEGYTVIIQKMRKTPGSSREGPVVCTSFKIGEPGKVVLSFHNPTSKKKKLLYRFKTKPSLDH